MDYEKAYNNALERARQIKDGKDEWRYSDLAEIIPALTYIFPELAESEDERIRKWIIEELEITRDAMSGKNPYSDDPDIVARLKRLDEAIAYLEKQKEPENTSASTMAPSCWEVERKEQKPTPDWMPKFLDELRSKKNYFDWDEHRDFEGHILAIINWIAPNYFNKKEQEQKPDIEICPHSIKSKSYKIQKPAEPSDEELVKHPPITYTYPSDASRDERLKAALLALLNSDLLKVKEGGYFTKQDLIEWVERIPTDKPAWSEEDNEMRLEAIRVLVSGCERYRKESGCLPGWHKVIDWLKSLKPQSKAEWSEEDENYLGVIVRLVEQVSGWPERAITEYTNWLKSLRPSWKPSEEHLSALLAVFNDPDNIGSQTCQLALTDLYEQLKKL